MEGSAKEAIINLINGYDSENIVDWEFDGSTLTVNPKASLLY